MNSRASVNEIVNFSTDLATLNQLDVKEPLLSFPFDHLYACHSESGDQSQTLVLDKEVEISTHCVVTEDSRVTRRLASLESQNKKLKNLLIYHLDLIQQQNDFMSKREKVFQALRQENDTLKSKVTGLERKLPSQRQVHVPIHTGPTATITSASVHKNVPSTSSENYLDIFNEILSPQGITNQFNTYNPDVNASKFTGNDVFDYVRSTDSDLVNYLSSELGISPILDSTNTSSALPDTFTMIDNKKTSKTIKKELQPATDSDNEPKYIVTTDSGKQKIHRNRKRATGIGSFSRMAKTITPDTTKPSNIYDSKDEDRGSTNKRAKTYGNNKQPSKYSLPYSELSGKLQLIDPIPPGADPYQLGEAEMRAQSPILKLMLQKNNQGRMRIYSDPMSGVTSTVTSATSSRRVYDTMSGNALKTSDAESLGMVSLRAKSRRESTNATVEDPELDVVKTDSDMDWSIFPSRPKERSLCDFSYGETSANLLKNPLDISKMSFNEIFDSSPVNADSSNTTELEPAPEKSALEKTKKKRARTTSLAGPTGEGEISEAKRTEGKRSRKRALSTAGTIKRDCTQKATAKPKARRAIRGKKIPVPGMSTKKLYHTCMGDPDVSWYLGLNPDIKKEDCDTDNTASNVEVPRWRVKSYSPLQNTDGTENMDDKIFEKRHQKLEAEERRQLRWHMRRVREQRHVERLRQRQRDPWAQNPSFNQAPSDYTVWPQPLRDIQYIEITDTLPVLAFGEEIPNLPDKSYVLPWVLRSSKAQKRSKRSKTLH